MLHLLTSYFVALKENILPCVIFICFLNKQITNISNNLLMS